MGPGCATEVAHWLMPDEQVVETPLIGEDVLLLLLDLQQRLLALLGIQPVQADLRGDRLHEVIPQPAFIVPPLFAHSSRGDPRPG